MGMPSSCQSNFTTTAGLKSMNLAKTLSFLRLAAVGRAISRQTSFAAYWMSAQSWAR